MDQSIGDFVRRLAQTKVDGPVTNQYTALDSGGIKGQANAIRRQNLRLYLGQMAAARPLALLVGEAPGYRGCRLTGVPFTSEAILLDEGIWPFGARAGYCKTAERQGIVKEATATMIWSSDVWKNNSRPFRENTGSTPPPLEISHLPPGPGNSVT